MKPTYSLIYSTTQERKIARDKPPPLSNNFDVMAGPGLKEIVGARLHELGINAFEAARRVGAQRTFVYDILHGRKVSVRGANLHRLAKALDLDPMTLFPYSDNGADEISPTNRAVRGLSRHQTSRGHEIADLMLAGVFEGLGLSASSARSLAQALRKEIVSSKDDPATEQGQDRMRTVGATLARIFGDR